MTNTGELREECGRANPVRGDAYYNEFYRNGGWKYSYWREYWWHRRHVVRRFDLRRGMRLLEVACGCGFHTDLFRRMGFRCVGIDRSRAGIAWAQKHYPRCAFHCCDVMSDLPVPHGGFDVILARGCSHYHYDLQSDQSLNTTRHLMRYAAPGGVFVMVIVTDLSGRRDPDQVWQNRIEAYEQHFASFGLPHSVDWHRGMAICGLRASQRTGIKASTCTDKDNAGPPKGDPASNHTLSSATARVQMTAAQSPNRQTFA